MFKFFKKLPLNYIKLIDMVYLIDEAEFSVEFLQLRSWLLSMGISQTVIYKLAWQFKTNYNLDDIAIGRSSFVSLHLREIIYFFQ